MSQKVLFKNRLIARCGFYVLYYSYGVKDWEERVYVSEITDHGGRVRSYFCLYHNYRDKPFRSAMAGKLVGHDMGKYVWNSSSSNVMIPVGWREMTSNEIDEMKKKLWKFDRVS